MKIRMKSIRRALSSARRGVVALGVVAFTLTACEDAETPAEEEASSPDAGTQAPDAAGTQPDAAPPPTDAGEAPRQRCRVTSEVRHEIGNEAYFFYHYDAQGRIEKATKGPLVQNKAETLTLTDYGHDILRVTGTPVTLQTRYDAVMRTANVVKPARSTLVIIEGMSTSPAFVDEFAYDAKGRLITVSRYTPEIENDSEPEVTITYDDKDNVVRLAHQVVRGFSAPSEVSETFVNGHDDHPTPYAHIPNYRFALTTLKHGWNHNDVEGFVTALSKNNPLEIVVAKDTEVERTRTMTYEYNAAGYPTKRMNALTATRSSKQFFEEFAYDCE